MGKLIKDGEPIKYSLDKPKRNMRRVESSAQKIKYLDRSGYSAILGEQSAREMIDTNKYMVIDNTSCRSSTAATPRLELETPERKQMQSDQKVREKLLPQFSKETASRENRHREEAYATAEFRQLLHDASIQQYKSSNQIPSSAQLLFSTDRETAASNEYTV